ncbi:MAG: 5-amino-6-(D-ribitylamino)uracil--L-tyrosine 4-hydroxyphenyl transferase CofH [Steroidobacteraceae bacterium]|jgi:FO synthase
MVSAVWAVVPVKRLAEAKRRLSAALGETREEFAYLLACRTLDVLRSAGLFAGIIVVTPDPRVAAAARARGAVVVDDADSSLNQACVLGLDAAAKQGASLAVLLPSDLATLTAEVLSRLVQNYSRLRNQQNRAIVLVRCKEGTGTNLVVLEPRTSFQPSFGPDSFSKHVREAGPDAHELCEPTVSFDIDTPEDLEVLRARFEEDHEAGAMASLLRGARTSPATTAWASAQALKAASFTDLAHRAGALRDSGYGTLVSYSPKVFLPLTQLCRDSCHYCTFAQAPRRLKSPYLSIEEAVSIATEGARLGCKEALFTLGERPELRYRAARDWLTAHGFESTLHYLSQAAAAVRDRTGLLPHINAGCMTAEEMAMLRPACASMGLMLESSAARLCEKGGPHYGSPDKEPALRLATIAEAGRQRIPFTTGILIGIGETRGERIEALLAIRELHERYGHIQEIIVQNFVPKRGTIMADAPAADAEELLWSIAAARVLFGPAMSIQAPPNLSPAPLPSLVQAGINDWGGVSPLTPDFVNPEAPWPELEHLREQTEAAGKTLVQRLTVYPKYAKSPEVWIDAGMRRAVLEQSDGDALGREDAWRTGRSTDLPASFATRYGRIESTRVDILLREIADFGAEHLNADAVAELFRARGSDLREVCEAADRLRARVNGDTATYVVNRNINYTNICGYHCSFCAFSKGTRKREGAERGYLLDIAEIVERTLEAGSRGATEVCLQGGIHPSFTGDTYLEIVRALKAADPRMHVHAFSPLEVWHGAETLAMPLRDYLSLLKSEGLGSLPGTAAEILVDEVRAILCPDKLRTEEWLEVIETAHEVGLPTTSTMMFGHVDRYGDWALHLLRLRDLQRRTQGLTEFVPLPFVAHEAPLYRRGRARPGPTLREAILVHAVARLVLHPHVENIQASWVKMGRAGMREALRAGANDLGGTLMNESITRAAGATHGQEMTQSDMLSLAASLGRPAVQRTTLYRSLSELHAREESGRVATASSGCTC